MAASNMPGYEGILTDEEMQAVLAYIKEAPTDIQRSQARATAAEPTNSTQTEETE